MPHYTQLALFLTLSSYLSLVSLSPLFLSVTLVARDRRFVFLPFRLFRLQWRQNNRLCGFRAADVVPRFKIPFSFFSQFSHGGSFAATFLDVREEILSKRIYCTDIIALCECEEI